MGVVGLGAMGLPMARNVIGAGLPLVVHDVRGDATAELVDRAVVAGSAAEVARCSDVVVVAVFDDEQVRAVLSGPDGGLAAARVGTVFLVVSTISPDCVAALGEEAQGAEVAVVDCGVTGGPGAAATGELVCMVGGDPASIERARPVLDAIGSLTLVMGPFGAGLAAKLARNLVQFGSWLAAYEGQVLAEAAGVELGKLAEAIRASDPHIGGITTLMFRSTVAPLTTDDDPGLVQAMRRGSRLAHKDLRGAIDLGQALGVALPLALMTDARCDDVFGLGSAGSPAGKASRR